MTDFLDRYAVQLRAAEQRLLREKARPRTSAVKRWPRRGHGRGLVALVAMLAVSGSAAAGVITLTSGHQASLSGVLPPSTPTRSGFPSTVGDRYHIEMWPSLQAGEAGWCSGLSYTKDGRAVGGQGNCADGAPSPRTPLFGGDVEYLDGLRPASEHVVYVFASPRVTAVRIAPNGPTLVPRHDPRLPKAFRALVLLEPPGAPTLMLRSLKTERALMMEHGLALSGVHSGSKPKITPQRRRFQWLVAVDRSGNPLPSALPSDPLVLPVTPWKPSQSPASSACSISASSLPGLRARSGSVVTRIRALPYLEGPAFLSCIDIEYELGGSTLTAAVLLNARRPGSAPAALPGSIGQPGQPGTVNLRGEAPYGALSARREGDAWLIVQGASASQRLTLLHALSSAT